MNFIKDPVFSHGENDPLVSVKGSAPPRRDPGSVDHQAQFLDPEYHRGFGDVYKTTLPANHVRDKMPVLGAWVDAEGRTPESAFHIFEDHAPGWKNLHKGFRGLLLRHQQAGREIISLPFQRFSGIRCPADNRFSRFTQTGVLAHQVSVKHPVPCLMGAGKNKAAFVSIFNKVAVDDDPPRFQIGGTENVIDPEHLLRVFIAEIKLSVEIDDWALDRI